MVSIYFGLPGCGKTTTLCMLANKYKYAYDSIRCNVPLGFDFVKPLDVDWLGKYNIERTLLLIDEGTIAFDSRDFKNFGKDKTSFFMLHRHYECDVIIFVQRWDAVDLKIRAVCERVYYVYRPALIGTWFTKIWRVPYKVVWPVNEKGRPIAGDLSMGYVKPTGLQTIFCQYIYRPRWYGYFDTLIHPHLPSIPESLDKAAEVESHV